MNIFLNYHDKINQAFWNSTKYFHN